MVTNKTHTFRFEYRKDSSGNHGLDTAWVDNVRMYNSSPLGTSNVTSLFNRTDSLSSEDWTAGGTAGGFVIGKPRPPLSAGRPGAQYGANSTSSSMERTVKWSSCSPACPKWLGAMQFQYFVDSQSGDDYLNVYIDNVKQDLDAKLKGTQGISGLNQYGSIRLPIKSSGNHTIKFEYSKDGSLSHGRDTAKIDHRYIASLAMAIFWSNIASVDVTGIARRSASLWPDSWPDRVDISYGFGKGWVVNRATPVAFYVPKQLVGSALFPHYQIFWEPLIDGVFNDDKEYRNPTRTDLFNIGNPGAEMGKLRAREFQRALS